MSRRKSKHPLPGRTDATPFAALAGAAERVGEATATLAARGLRLTVSPDRQHWKVDDAAGRIAEWWPATSRFVARGQYTRPALVLTVETFVNAVKSGMHGPRRLALGSPCVHPCPDCGSTMVLRDSRHGLFYGCSTYPKCTATHGAHKATGEPLGIPADTPTKAERMATHALFDRLWKGDPPAMGRKEAYAWMAERMGLTKDEAHIGRFDGAACRRLRELVLEHFPALASEAA